MYGDVFLHEKPTQPPLALQIEVFTKTAHFSTAELFTYNFLNLISMVHSSAASLPLTLIAVCNTVR